MCIQIYRNNTHIDEHNVHHVWPVRCQWIIQTASHAQTTSNQCWLRKIFTKTLVTVHMKIRIERQNHQYRVGRPVSMTFSSDRPNMFTNMCRHSRTQPSRQHSKNHTSFYMSLVLFAYVCIFVTSDHLMSSQHKCPYICYDVCVIDTFHVNSHV